MHDDCVFATYSNQRFRSAQALNVLVSELLINVSVCAECISFYALSLKNLVE